MSRDEENLRGFGNLVQAGGAHVALDTDIQIERWKKLVGNATWNPICALSRCRDLELLQASPLGRELVRAAMHEVFKVAAAVGYSETVNEQVIESQLERTARRTWPGMEPSMMADINRGSRLEVEAILGEVVKIARDKRVAVPRLETLLVLSTGLDWFLQMQRANDD